MDQLDCLVGASSFVGVCDGSEIDEILLVTRTMFGITRDQLHGHQMADLRDFGDNARNDLEWLGRLYDLGFDAAGCKQQIDEGTAAVATEPDRGQSSR